MRAQADAIDRGLFLGKSFESEGANWTYEHLLSETQSESCGSSLGDRALSDAISRRALMSAHCAALTEPRETPLGGRTRLGFE